mmetsp:Transcript_27570/g.69814  ORF Transcript_27570/g.69814 Transcript_27570/m.69814 type:complete len:272 (-) Transcript_27570:132-947(-)
MAAPRASVPMLARWATWAAIGATASRTAYCTPPRACSATCPTSGCSHLAGCSAESPTRYCTPPSSRGSSPRRTRAARDAASSRDSSRWLPSAMPPPRSSLASSATSPSRSSPPRCATVSPPPSTAAPPPARSPRSPLPRSGPSVTATALPLQQSPWPSRARPSGVTTHSSRSASSTPCTRRPSTCSCSCGPPHSSGAPRVPACRWGTGWSSRSSCCARWWAPRRSTSCRTRSLPPHACRSSSVARRYACSYPSSARTTRCCSSPSADSRRC